MTAEGGPQATVIVPTFGDWAPLARCLACLDRQNSPKDIFEILVADNNPEGARPAGLALPANARLIREPKPGSYAARNAALRQARGRVVFFTDADCMPDPSWIATGLQAFAEDPSLARVSGGIEIVPAGGDWNAWSLYDRIYRLRQSDYARLGKAATANLAVRAGVFERIGPFSEATYSGGDMEWNARAQAAGLALRHLPSMVVQHEARDTFAAQARKTRRIAGARFQSRAETHPLSRRLPRVEYALPSLRALRMALSERQHPLSLRLGAWGAHYALRWVDIVETIRLGCLGKTPERR